MTAPNEPNAFAMYDAIVKVLTESVKARLKAEGEGFEVTHETIGELLRNAGWFGTLVEETVTTAVTNMQHVIEANVAREFKRNFDICDYEDEIRDMVASKMEEAVQDTISGGTFTVEFRP